jgi:hypothetical protein
LPFLAPPFFRGDAGGAGRVRKGGRRREKEGGGGRRREKEGEGGGRKGETAERRRVEEAKRERG